MYTAAYIPAAAQAGTAHNGMCVAILGDSNTWLGGDGCDRPRGWSKWFREAFAPTECRSYARSGATWTNTVRTVRDVKEYTELLSDNNVIYNQVNRLVDAVAEGCQSVPDLIIISAGTNDAWFGESRPEALSKTAGEVFDTPDNTPCNGSERITDRAACTVLALAEAVLYCCEMLKDSFPRAKIVLLTPLQSTAVSTEKIHLAGDIIEGCALRMGLGVIRQDGDDFVCSKLETKRKRMTTDGTHTNEKGARRNGETIAAEVAVMTGTGCGVQAP